MTSAMSGCSTMTSTRAEPSKPLVSTHSPRCSGQERSLGWRPALHGAGPFRLLPGIVPGSVPGTYGALVSPGAGARPGLAHERWSTDDEMLMTELWSECDSASWTTP